MPTGYGNNRAPSPPLGFVGIRGVTWFALKVVTSAGGAISAQTAFGSRTGISAAKTGSEVGRYTMTLPSAYKYFLGGYVNVIAGDDAAYGANTVGGPTWCLRDDDVDGGAADGTFEVQFLDSATNADAELPDGYSFIALFACGKGI